MVSRSALTLISSSREQWETEAVVSPSWLLRRRGMASRTCLRYYVVSMCMRLSGIETINLLACLGSYAIVARTPSPPRFLLSSPSINSSAGDLVGQRRTLLLWVASKPMCHVVNTVTPGATQWHFSLCERGVYTVSVNSISVDDYVAYDRFPLTSGMRH